MFDFGFSFSFIRPNNNYYIRKETFNSDLSYLASTLLKWMQNNGGVLKNVKDASEIIDRKERKTREIISELMAKDFLERVGSTKNGYWKLR